MIGNRINEFERRTEKVQVQLAKAAFGGLIIGLGLGFYGSEFDNDTILISGAIISVAGAMTGLYGSYYFSGVEATKRQYLRERLKVEES